MSIKSHFPLLVVDIGGTNVRFGWVANFESCISDVQTFSCKNYARPQDAADEYLENFQGSTRPARIAIGIASAVTTGPIKVTNSHWVLDRSEFAQSIGGSQVEIFNDFEAIALALPYMTEADYTLIGSGKPNVHQPMGVIGPGTGLGVAGLIPIRENPGVWQTVCGEGGHVTMSASTAYQTELLRVASRSHAHVSAEDLISGIGLPALRRAVAEVESMRIDVELDAEQIGTLGAARQDRLCEHTMEAFCCLLGGVAGNLALTLGATGGVFIAGGIVPKLGEFFMQSGFRSHFEAKGRYVEYLSAIATPVITAQNPGLKGLVSIIKQASAASARGSVE